MIDFKAPICDCFNVAGLVWSGKNAPVGVPPPPPSCPLPPPPLDNFPPAAPNASDDRSALFAQLNQGANITSSTYSVSGALDNDAKYHPSWVLDLRKVTSDMQTHKNPALKQGGVVSSIGSGVSATLAGQPDKPPVFTRDGKKWMIVSEEYPSAATALKWKLLNHFKILSSIRSAFSNLEILKTNLLWITKE